MADLKVEEGIKLLEKVAKESDIKIYLKSSAFEMLFPTDTLIMDERDDKLNIHMPNNRFTVAPRAIERCSLYNTVHYTLMEFYLHEDFRVCFEY